MASTQPLSEVAIANFAVTTLDESALTTLDDGGNLGRFMKREFGFVRDELLRKHPWNFATTRALLPKLSTTPAFGYAYQYAIPSDCLRLLPLRKNGCKNGASIRYEPEDGKILTNEDAPLKIRYIKRVTDPTKFDPLFARAFGQLLALMAAQRVTGKSSYVAKAQEAYAQALGEAFLVNSLEQGEPEHTNDGYGASGYDAITARGAGY